MTKQEQIRRMSEREFAELGAPKLVYIRPIKQEDGSVSFRLHAADGEELASLSSFHEAVALARHNSCAPVRVH